MPRFCFLAGSVCVAGDLRAASFDERVEMLFRPPLAEMITLSPEGQRVAYTTRSGGDISIVMMIVELPGPKRTVVVDPDREITSATEKAPVRLRFLRWATAGRLVYAPTERIVPLPPVVEKGRSVPNPDG